MGAFFLCPPTCRATRIEARFNAFLQVLLQGLEHGRHSPARPAPVGDPVLFTGAEFRHGPAQFRQKDQGIVAEAPFLPAHRLAGPGRFLGPRYTCPLHRGRRDSSRKHIGVHRPASSHSKEVRFCPRRLVFQSHPGIRSAKNGCPGLHPRRGPKGRNRRPGWVCPPYHGVPWLL